MTVTRATADGRIVEVEDGRAACESSPSKIPAAYRTCPLCKKIYAEAPAGAFWRQIILDGNQVSVCAGCERRLTRLVEG